MRPRSAARRAPPPYSCTALAATLARVMRLAGLAVLVRDHVGHDTLALPNLDIEAFLNRAGLIDGRQIVWSLALRIVKNRYWGMVTRPPGPTMPNILKSLFF